MIALPIFLKSNRTAVAFFGLICVAVSAASFYFSIAKPFTLDEVEMAIRARMLVKAGPHGPEMFFGKGDGEAVPHPPLYDYSLAAVFRLLGESEPAGRSFGMICFVLVGLLMTLSLKYLLEEESVFLRHAAIFTALGLYAVNPLIIQHSMLIDADAAYSFLFLNLFMYFFIRFEKNRPGEWLRPRLALACFFAILCLSKEGTPFLAASGILVYRFLKGQWKQAAADLFLTVLLGAAIAWSVWLIFCHFTGVDTMIFIKQQYSFRYSKMAQRLLSMDWVKMIRSGINGPVYWMSPAFFILLAACLFRRLRCLWGAAEIELSDVCLLVGLTVWLPYQLIRPSYDMMKYQHPVYPIFIIGIVCGVVALLRPAEVRLRQWFDGKNGALFGVIFLAALLCFYYYSLGDSVRWVSYQADRKLWTHFRNLYWLPIFGLLGVVAAVSIGRKRFLTELFALSCMVLIFSANIALDLQQTAPYTTVESWLNYGQSGLRETADYLSSRISADTPCSLRKDIAYYLKLDHGIDLSNNRNPSYLLRDQPLHEALRDYQLGIQPVYVVLDPVVMASNARLQAMAQVVFQQHILEKKIGSFMIIRLKNKPQNRLSTS